MGRLAAGDGRDPYAGDIAGLKAALTAHPELKGNETALKQTDAYRKAMKEYGTGSDLQKAAQAVTGR